MDGRKEKIGNFDSSTVHAERGKSAVFEAENGAEEGGCHQVRITLKNQLFSLTSFRIARYCTPSIGWRFFATGGKMGIFRPFMGKKWGSFLNANEPSRGPGV